MILISTPNDSEIISQFDNHMMFEPNNGFQQEFLNG